MFYVGQKVVCVDDTVDEELARICGNRKMDGLTTGVTYTIREAGLIHELDPQRRPCVRLLEIMRGRLTDSPFRATRFRPITARETDISIFKRMLTPSEGEPVA